MSTEPQPGLMPEHMRTSYRGDQPPVMMTVDGQDFRVRERAEEPGVYDFDWLSGPHEGYGFGITRSADTAMSRDGGCPEVRGTSVAAR